MAYKQQPKSPMLKALKGNQGKLPQHLQDAIKAAPESPAKQTKTEGEKKAAKRAANVRVAADSTKLFNEQQRYPEWMRGVGGAEARAHAAGGIARKNEEKRSPTKQTTAAEFAYEKSLKDKEMGKSTKVVDKFTSALEAPFSDKTYSELKKEKRAKQKAKYNAKSPAKQTSPGSVTTRKKHVPRGPETPVGPKAEKPKTKKEVFMKKVNKKRYE